MLRPIPKKMLYSDTITGLRISSVDGTAFLDACAALVPYADGESDIYIYDSVGAFLKATLKAQGTGETLGGELYSSANAASDPNSNEADATTGWSNKGDGVITSQNSIVDTGTYALKVEASTNNGALYPTSLTQNSLFKSSWTRRHLGTGTGSASWVVAVGSGSNAWPFYASDTFTVSETTYQSMSKYGTAHGTTSSLLIASYGSVDGGAYCDNISVKQVLTPSTDGVTLQASKWDTTESFGVKAAGFKYNEASYAVRVFKAR